jgi:hypothetical protein
LNLELLALSAALDRECEFPSDWCVLNGLRESLELSHRPAVECYDPVAKLETRFGRGASRGDAGDHQSLGPDATIQPSRRLGLDHQPQVAALHPAEFGQIAGNPPGHG